MIEGSKEVYILKLIRFYEDGIVCHNLAHTDDDYKKGRERWGYKRDIYFNWYVLTYNLRNIRSLIEMSNGDWQRIQTGIEHYKAGRE